MRTLLEDLILQACSRPRFLVSGTSWLQRADGYLGNSIPETLSPSPRTFFVPVRYGRPLLTQSRDSVDRSERSLQKMNTLSGKTWRPMRIWRYAGLTRCSVSYFVRELKVTAAHF